MRCSPSYAEADRDQDRSNVGAAPAPVIEKLTMYVAQARFILDRPPGAIELARYVTLPFLEKVDPAIQHKEIAAADVDPFKTDVRAPATTIRSANGAPAGRR